jgi:hypothetical protein
VGKRQRELRRKHMCVMALRPKSKHTVSAVGKHTGAITYCTRIGQLFNQLIYQSDKGTMLGIDCSYCSELDFLNILWCPGTEKEYRYRTGPPGYIGWQN